MQNVAIRAGYKLTEVGVIPEDWTISTIGQEFEVKLGKMLDAEKNVGIAKPYLGNRAIQWGRIDISNLSNVPMTCSDIARFRLRKGDLLVCEGGEVGRAAIWDAPIEECYYQKALFRLRALRGFEVRVMLELLHQWSGRGFLTNYVTQTSIAHLPCEKFMGIPIPVPPLPEQRLIATALSDMDELLGGLDRLIAKKHDLKQATMQQLLRSKEEWIEYPLSEICWFQEGPGVRNHQFTDSGVKLFNGTNIEKGKVDLNKTNRYISKHEAFGWYSHFLADAGDIVIACSGISIDKFDEKVALIEAQHLPLCMNTSTMRFKIKKEMIDKSYLLHFLRSSLFKVQIGGTATGSAQLNFGPSHVSVVKIQLPELDEQREIATILSDMDTAIAALEQRRNKTRDLKQAMMQELLTGRIRLKIEA